MKEIIKNYKNLFKKLKIKNCSRPSLQHQNNIKKIVKVIIGKNKL